GLDILRYMMPPRVQKGMDLTSLALIFFFGVGMAWYGTSLSMGTWTATIPVLGWPGGTDFFPLIGGGFLIALFSAERFVDLAIGEDIAADVIVQEAA
ncbi:TRAP transporter small permease subunit, partial [Agrobacterium sp. S2]|nr:TRAP transporter small permease subunit [Agrobacterium sp. S2]